MANAAYPTWVVRYVTPDWQTPRTTWVQARDADQAKAMVERIRPDLLVISIAEEVYRHHEYA